MTQTTPMNQQLSNNEIFLSSQILDSTWEKLLYTLGNALFIVKIFHYEEGIKSNTQDKKLSTLFDDCNTTNNKGDLP